RARENFLLPYQVEKFNNRCCLQVCIRWIFTRALHSDLFANSGDSFRLRKGTVKQPSPLLQTMSGPCRSTPPTRQPRAQAKPPPLPQRSNSGRGSGGGTRGVTRQLSVQLARGGGPFRRTHCTLREAADDSQGGFLALRVIRELANSAAVSAACASDRDSGFATVNEESGGVYESLSSSSCDADAGSLAEDNVVAAKEGISRRILRRGSMCAALGSRQSAIAGGSEETAARRCQRRPSVPDGMGSLARPPHKRPSPPLPPRMPPPPPPPPPPRRRQSAGTAASTSVPASAIACPEPPEPRTAGIDSTIPRATYAEQIRQAHRRLQPQQKHPQAVSRHSSVSIVTSRPPELPPRRCRRDSPARFHQDSYIMNRSGFARSESGGQFHRPKQDRNATGLVPGAQDVSGATSSRKHVHQHLVSSPSLPVSLLQPDVQPQAHGQQQPDNSFARLSLEFNAELRAVPTLSSDSSESPESPSSPFASLSRPFPELAEPEAAAPLEPELGDDAGGGDSDGDGAEDELLPLSTQDAEEPHNESLEMLRTNLGDLRLRLEQAEANLLGSWRQLVMERCQATGALDSYDRYLSRLGPLARLRCQLDRRRRRLRQQQQQLDAAALPAEMEELRQRTCELERQLDEARQLAGSVGRNRRRLLAELRRRLAPGELMKLQEAVQHRMLLAEQAEATRIRVLCAQEHHSPCSC
ncbi:hypothetical protein BOX15_Mlig023564g4, partial [Macrostomum lignano]